MKRAQSWAIVLGCTLILGHMAGDALAAETGAAKIDAPKTEEEGVGGKMVDKAIRGGQNLAFGLVTEVPRTIYYESRDHGPLYGFAIGLFKGLGLGAIRTGVGAYELLTFPLPANDYEPVVLPALPFEPGPTEVFPDTP